MLCPNPTVAYQGVAGIGGRVHGAVHGAEVAGPDAFREFDCAAWQLNRYPHNRT